MNTSAAGAGERDEVWRRTVTVPWMLVTGCVAAVCLVVAEVVLTDLRYALIWLFVAALAFVALGSVRVVVDRRGVLVSSVAIPLLRRRVPYGSVARAWSDRGDPLRLGGWGYRWKPGTTAVSLRAGDALWLDLTSGRCFVITVDDAGAAAALVNARLDPDVV
ncbi:hypothetical protein ACFV3R_15880 [Streptomyces sp. NPDC059740]|uniref:hypothetical protein n=1 Tax=Streptomyces sp. NPDC059740 TaxID=3346926 RepID=UPI003668DA8C